MSFDFGMQSCLGLIIQFHISLVFIIYTKVSDLGYHGHLIYSLFWILHSFNYICSCRSSFNTQLIKLLLTRLFCCIPSLLTAKRHEVTYLVQCLLYVIIKTHYVLMSNLVIVCNNQINKDGKCLLTDLPVQWKSNAEMKYGISNLTSSNLARSQLFHISSSCF